MTTSFRPVLLENLDALYFDGDEVPDVFKFVFRGVEWLTDRFWILRRDIVAVTSDVPVRELPSQTSNSFDFLAAALDNDLAPAGRIFAPAFAGALTHAGIAAFDCGYVSPSGGRALAALVRDGERVGCLMPLRGPTDANATSIPAPPAVLKMFDRIDDTGIVGRNEAWCLAVAMTSGDAA